MTLRICDRCNSEMERISKKGFSRFLGRFAEVHRYQCQNTTCKSEKLIFPELQQKSLFKFLLPFIVTLGIPLLLISGLVIFANSSLDQSPPQSITPAINKK